MTVLRRAVRLTARCRLLVKRAERLKVAAKSERDLFLVEVLLRRVLRRRACAPAVRHHALEQLALLLSQRSETHERAEALMRRGSYEYRLSPQALCYPLETRQLGTEKLFDVELTLAKESAGPWSRDLLSKVFI